MEGDFSIIDRRDLVQLLQQIIRLMKSLESNLTLGKKNWSFFALWNSLIRFPFLLFSFQIRWSTCLYQLQLEWSSNVPSRLEMMTKMKNQRRWCWKICQKKENPKRKSPVKRQLFDLAHALVMMKQMLKKKSQSRRNVASLDLQLHLVQNLLKQLQPRTRRRPPKLDVNLLQLETSVAVKLLAKPNVRQQARKWPMAAELSTLPVDEFSWNLFLSALQNSRELKIIFAISYHRKFRFFINFFVFQLWNFSCHKILTMNSANHSTIQGDDCSTPFITFIQYLHLDETNVCLRSFNCPSLTVHPPQSSNDNSNSISILSFIARFSYLFRKRKMWSNFHASFYCK